MAKTNQRKISINELPPSALVISDQILEELKSSGTSDIVISLCEMRAMVMKISKSSNAATMPKRSRTLALDNLMEIRNLLFATEGIVHSALQKA